MQDLLYNIIKILDCIKSDDVKKINLMLILDVTKINLKINLMQDLLHIIILDCKI